MNDHFIYNNTVILVLGIVLLLAFAAWLYMLHRKNPSLDLGELMATMAVDKNETIFVICVFGIFMAEAFVAATVHAPGEPPPNPLARITSHVLISVIGTVASVTAVRDIAGVFYPGLSKLDRFIRIILAFFIVSIAMAIPYANLILIASGLGQYSAFDLWTYSLKADEISWQRTLAQFELPANYQAFASLQTILKTSIVLTFVHYGLNFLEGLRNVSSIERRNMLFRKIEEELANAKERAKGKDPAKGKPDVNKDPMPGEERQYKEVAKNLKFLLSRVGYSGDELGKMVTLCETKVNKIKHQGDRMKMAARIGSLVTKARTIDASSSSDRAKQKQDLQKEIYAFFQNPWDESKPIDQRGLGQSIKGGAGKS